MKSQISSVESYVSLHWYQTRCFTEHKVRPRPCTPVPELSNGRRALGWLIASLLPCQPVAVKATELQDGPGSGASQLLFLGLQGHFLRGTDKAFASSWWELDRVCVCACQCVCILNLARNSEIQRKQQTSPSQSASGGFCRCSPLEGVSLQNTQQQKRQKKITGAEYEDFWQRTRIKSV